MDMARVCLTLVREMSQRKDIPDDVIIKMQGVAIYFLENQECKNEENAKTS